MVLTNIDTFTHADQKIHRQEDEKARRELLEKADRYGYSPEEIAAHAIRKLGSGRRALEVPTKPVGAPGEVHPAPLRSAHADTDAAWLAQSDQSEK